MARIYLSLGSNVGDRRLYLNRALIELAKIITITKKSRIIETAPLDYERQRKFLNMVLEADTKISPINLLKIIKKIEKKLGRIERFRYGPREIDIDILLYGKKNIKLTNLEVPHPRLNKRKFFLKLLKSLDQNFKIDHNTSK